MTDPFLFDDKRRGHGRGVAAQLLGMLLICSSGASANAQEAPAPGATAPGAPGCSPEPEREVPEFMRLEPLPPDAPKPPSDPRSFEGTWFHADLVEMVVAKTMHGKPVPMRPEARKIVEHRVAAEQAGSPVAHAATLCLPPGPSWQLDLNFPFTVIHDKHEIYFVFEELHGVWKIRMNQPHRRDGAREYMGDSVGHWEGDTLVVDTIDYKAPWWVDGSGIPMTKDAHVIHRIRRIDEAAGPALEVVTTFDDPAMFEGKWSVMRAFVWRPDKAIFKEYNCEEQLGAPDGLSRYGVVKE